VTDGKVFFFIKYEIKADADYEEKSENIFGEVVFTRALPHVIAFLRSSDSSAALTSAPPALQNEDGRDSIRRLLPSRHLGFYHLETVIHFVGPQDEGAKVFIESGKFVDQPFDSDRSKWVCSHPIRGKCPRRDE